MRNHLDLALPSGNPELAQACLSTEQRFLRLAGQASPTPAEGEVIVELLVCRQSACAPDAQRDVLPIRGGQRSIAAWAPLSRASLSRR